MNRMSTGLCFAAAVGFAVTLGAQAPTSTATSSRSTMDKEHDVTLTGCLSKATAGYTLTNAHVDTNAASSTTTTPGSATAGTTGTTGNSRDAASSMAASTWMLSGDNDLEKHVGHKIQVTGKTSWDASMDHARAAGTTATPPSTTSAASAASSTAEPKLDVKSIKMVSSSCS